MPALDLAENCLNVVEDGYSTFAGISDHTSRVAKPSKLRQLLARSILMAPTRAFNRETNLPKLNRKGGVAKWEGVSLQH
jgi:hypothetical protein